VYLFLFLSRATHQNQVNEKQFHNCHFVTKSEDGGSSSEEFVTKSEDGGSPSREFVAKSEDGGF
jgi:hypothetical protein